MESLRLCGVWFRIEVSGLGFRVVGLVITVETFGIWFLEGIEGFNVFGPEFYGFRIQDLGFRVWELRFQD